MTVHAPDVAGHVQAFHDAVHDDLPMFEYGQVPGEKDSAGVLVPGVKPTIYGLITVERIGVEPLAMARHSRRTQWRASLRAVGRYTADNCRAALVHIIALENTRLTVDGHTSTPLHIESTEDARPDAGEYSSLVRITYAL